MKRRMKVHIGPSLYDLVVAGLLDPSKPEHLAFLREGSGSDDFGSSDSRLSSLQNVTQVISEFKEGAIKIRGLKVVRNKVIAKAK